MTYVLAAGCGYWGKNIVRNLRDLGALAGIVEDSEAGRARARELAPETEFFSTLAEGLAATGASAVAVATPASTHFRLVAEALSAGRDVFCEKPLALRFREGAALVRQAAAGDRILMVGHLLEYHPAIRRLRELVDSGELGDLRYLYSNRLNLGKIRQEENILWSFAPHDIAIALRLAGDTPFQVVATGGAYVTPNVYDATVTQLLFDEGVRAHIFVSWLHPFKEQRLVVVGSRKMVVWDDVGKSLLLYDQRVDMSPDGVPTPVKAEPVAVDYPPDEPLRLQMQAFLDALGTRQPPLTSGESALEVLRVLEAAERSLVTGGVPVTLPSAGGGEW